MPNAPSNEQPDRSFGLPSYPKAFFENMPPNPQPDHVFVAMPFRSLNAGAMWRTIKNACGSIHLRPIRADSLRRPRSILGDILQEIGQAGIIIADLTDLNANVFYELGIAHCQCRDVVLISRKDVPLPFDLATMRCIFYDPAHKLWQNRLKGELVKTLRDISAGRSPVLIDGPLMRTNQVVSDLKTLGELPDQFIKDAAIWSSSFMSVLAITPAEGKAPVFDNDDIEPEDHAALLTERETLLQVVRRGCRLKCIVTPACESNTVRPWMGHGRQRTEALLEFLRSDDAAHDNIDWAVSVIRQKNIYVIGGISCIEGFKQHFRRGYDLSVRQTAPEAIDVNVRLLDLLFERLAQSMLGGATLRERERRAALRKATIEALEKSLKFLDGSEQGGAQQV